MRRKLTMALALMLSCNLFAQQNLNTIANTVKERITISGYAQAGFTYDNLADPNNEFDLKRVVLTAKGEITDRWSTTLMANLKTGKMLEFYTDYKFFPFLHVKFGQFKTAFTLENIISSSDIDIISGGSQSVRYMTGGDGSDIMYGANSGRDLGLMVYGHFLHGFLNYELGVMNGQGMNRSDRNSHKDLVGRFTFNVFDVLKLSSSFTRGRGNALIGNPDFNIETGQNYRRDRWSMGVDFISPFFDLRSEFLRGKDGSIKSKGAYATTNIHLLPKFDLIGSFDYFNKNRNIGDVQTDYIAGLQYWFYPKCRLQAQYVFSDSRLHKNGSSIQAQVQIAF